MKQPEKGSGRGFDSRLVHQKAYSVGATNHIKQISSMSMLPNGPAMVSTGQ